MGNRICEEVLSTHYFNRFCIVHRWNICTTQFYIHASPECHDFIIQTKLCVIINIAGEVQFSKNGSTPLVFMHVDQTLQLWAFFDVYGSTQKVRILGSCVEPHHSVSSSGQSLYIAPYMKESCFFSIAVVTTL
jgi:hypothetical protein